MRKIGVYLVSVAITAIATVVHGVRPTGPPSAPSVRALPPEVEGLLPARARLYFFSDRHDGMDGKAWYEVASRQRATLLEERDGSVRIETAAREQGWIVQGDRHLFYGLGDDPPPLVAAPLPPAPARFDAAPEPSDPHAGMVYVKGYRRKDGAYVSGYWRRR